MTERQKRHSSAPHWIDLRSDTVSHPTPEMRAVMAEAPVGDDVFRGDPSVIALEEKTANLLEKEAALFVPSGTMANQIALRLHLRPGQFVIGDARSHILSFEAGSTAGLSGVAAVAVAGEKGQPTSAQLAASPPFASAVGRSRAQYVPPKPGLLVLENTQNAAGGTVWPLADLEASCAWARSEGLACHLDGARLWNASAASGVSEAEYAAPFDTISVCFSKGLGAPVGSALVGSSAAIADARRIRAQLGGAMRQSGHLAAAAHHALDHHRNRLSDDHINACRLASGLANLPGLIVDAQSVETNIVLIRMDGLSAGDFVDAAYDAGVGLIAFGNDIVRAVTCLDISADDIEVAIERLAVVCDKIGGADVAVAPGV